MKRFIITVVAAAGLLGFGSTTVAQEIVKLGAVLSLSGPAGAFGVPERDAIELLVQRHNKTAGAGDRRYELIVYDDQTNPTEAARGATKLIEQDKVVGILGPTTGSGALALMPIAAKAQVPVVAPVSTVGVVSKEREFFPWIFRSMPSDDVSARKQFDQVVMKPGLKRIAIFHQEDAFGKFGAEFIVRMAKENNVEVVAVTSAPASSIDVTAAAIKIRNAKPDLVMLQAFAPALGAAFLRSSRQVGLAAPIAGSGGLNQRAFFELAGPSANGMFITGFGNWDEPSKQLRQLEQVLKEGGKQHSGFGEILGGSAFAVLHEGVRKVQGPVTGKKLRDALETICDFDGTYFDAKVCYSAANHEGVPAEATLLMVVEKGKLKTVAR